MQGDYDSDMDDFMDLMQGQMEPVLPRREVQQQQQTTQQLVQQQQQQKPDENPQSTNCLT